MVLLISKRLVPPVQSSFEKGKPTCKRTRIDCPMPLVTSQTLFSLDAWANAINFISARHQVAHEQKLLPDLVSVQVKLLHMSKGVGKDSGKHVIAAKKIFAPLRATLVEDLRERDKRRNELFLNFSLDGLKFRVYEYRNTYCFGVAGAESSIHSGKCAEFREEDACSWKTNLDTFVEFIRAVQKAMTPGDPYHVAAAFTVSFGTFASINIRVFHEDLPTDRVFNVACPDRHYKPAAYNGLIGTVPRPIQEIVFH
jgi:hypothetical protein